MWTWASKQNPEFTHNYGFNNKHSVSRNFHQHSIQLIPLHFFKPIKQLQNFNTNSVLHF